VTTPGPVDKKRLLVLELIDGAAAGLAGAVRPDWDAAK
jgi:predicted N-acetyltransferase YhbS